MENYDVIVVGAGPAGCQCARSLSSLGHKVALIEKYKCFTSNDFSSGGAPLALLSEYKLPDSVVGRFWNKLFFSSSNVSHSWQNPHGKGGIVFDFCKLRTFLAKDAESKGCKIFMGWTYESHIDKSEYIHLQIKKSGEEEKKQIQTRIVVDATGTDRAVLAKKRFIKEKSVVVTGLEYVIKVDRHIYDFYDKSLNFYFGKAWMPQGYGWIFPMNDETLKIGVCRYFAQNKFVPHENSYKKYFDNLIQKTVGNTYQMLERHGKTICYVPSQKDIYSEKNVLAIGDSISMVNPLAGEGIRHALASGQMAARHIEKALHVPRGITSSYLLSYEKEAKKYQRVKWFFSECMMKKLYKESNDSALDGVMYAFKQMNYNQIFSLTFQYKITTFFQFCYYYLKNKVKKFSL